MKLMITIIFIVNVIGLEAQTNKADAVIGEYYTPDNTSIVEIFKKGNKYYGKMIWLKEPTDKNGSLKKDIKNPNPDLQNRTMKGTVFMNFVYEEDYKWKGKIYNFRDGKNYNANMKLSDMNTLEVRGYIGFTWLGKTSIWKRKN